MNRPILISILVLAVAGGLVTGPAAEAAPWTKARAEDMKVLGCSFANPTPDVPYFHAIVLIHCRHLKKGAKMEQHGNSDVLEFELKGVEINGRPVEEYKQERVQKKPWTRYQESSVIRVTAHCDWLSKRKYQIKLVTGAAELKCTGIAPDKGGHIGTDWRAYKVVTLEETAGIARVNEPMILSMKFPKDTVSDLARELRVVEVKSATGATRELPSQLCGKGVRDGNLLKAQVAFLANVPAKSRRVYLVYYGNPKATPAKYDAGLSVKGKELSSVIANEHYQAKLRNGQILSIDLKCGSGRTQAWNGTVHWTPDYCAVEPYTWFATRYAPMKHRMVKGPVMITMERWGFPIGKYKAQTQNDIFMSLKYYFFAHSPYILVETTYEARKDVALYTLRMDEFIAQADMYDANIFPGGSAPKHHSLDWIGFRNSKTGDAMASIPLSYRHLRRGGGEATLSDVHLGGRADATLGDNPKHIEYWERCIINDYVRPFMITHVKKGSIYAGRHAYLFFRYNEADKARPITRCKKTLAHPLRARWLTEWPYVRVVVRDQAGLSVPGAIVKVLDSQGRMIEEYRSDADGVVARITLREKLPEGFRTYYSYHAPAQLEAGKQGYAAVRRTLGDRLPGELVLTLQKARTDVPKNAEKGKR